MNVTVIDSIMGSGKTTWMIDRINKHHWQATEDSTTVKPKYIYITPTLDEVDRVTEACSLAEFKNPQPVNGKKYWHFETLVREGQNICTTHSLFKLLSREVHAELKERGYTLVIDEALDCVDIFTGLSEADRKLLMERGMVSVEPETYRLVWNEDDHHNYRGEFEHIMALCRNGNLIHFKHQTMLWEFPVEFLSCFKQVYVLSYLFHGNAMANYLAASGVKLDMFGIQGGKLVPWDQVDEGAIKGKLRELVTVYDGRGNKIGARNGKDNPLSSSWYKRAKEADLNAIRAATLSFFKAVAKTPSRLNMYTTFKAYKSKVAGEGYAKGFLPNNLRGTNAYKDKQSAAYLCNTFYHPVISSYFTQRGVTTYGELFGLSEMIQWLWRSQIRDDKPIHVFIPSERMRGLFMAWLGSDTVEELFTKTGSGSPPEMA